jgi:dsDNA-binding SOS-regulon protein
VAQFDSVAQRLADTLQHTAQGMEEAAGRSDEQLAYYVAQAREVIDHSALAQQKLLDQLREISRSV